MEVKDQRARQWEWQTVSRRHTGRANERSKKIGVTFFFRNFPDYCSQGDLRRSFEAVGRVQDIFIPRKRDLQGKRFGFVRFFSHDKQELLLERLNKVWIGSHIIRAFVPRFQRAAPVPPAKVRKAEPLGDKKVAQHIPSNHGIRIQGLSYSDVLSGRRRLPPEASMEEEQLMFSSQEEEGEWLRGAYTGRLKDEFSWRDHGEEIQQECSGKLILRDMGNHLILIQSETRGSTDQMIQGFDEWASFWLDWWKPWSAIDVNQHRSIWTRWIGVPLHAWSLRFFCLASSKFGRLEELHDVTKSRRRLDEAYVRISTSLATIDRIMKCNIDNSHFQIRIEEIRCMENINHLHLLEDSDSDAYSDSMSNFEWFSDDSVDATAGFRSDLDAADGETVQGGADALNSPKTISRAAAHSPSGSVSHARDNNYGGCFQIRADPEVTFVGSHIAQSVSQVKETAGLQITGLSNSIGPNQLNSPSPINSQKGLELAHPLQAQFSDAPETCLRLPSSSTHSYKSLSPPRARAQEKTSRRKSSRIPFDPKEFEAFISSMASGGELVAKGKRKRKGARNLNLRNKKNVNDTNATLRLRGRKTDGDRLGVSKLGL